ncbi:5-carboxymethyl-2-hydroxymuconate Delta-isomerase [uncultured Cocleimonas sp.]|uniref:5-carboxymethyl-2-hydroxymuconate Delta-isomerase n=1 Tax=uncultured Cocleimonas sp. TaxID=1051587 RepID=UPI002626DD34|nr:5-carboxymethyl-2-hydroxymuconate Delta-isomerase [uncultured Cocleimonas sp.]
MPHCIIEHSEDVLSSVNQQQLIDTVLTGAKKSALFELDHIKLRTQSYEYYQKGDVKQAGFIHVTLRILEGRTEEQRQELSEKVLSEFDGLSLKRVTITVEIVEMETASYSKKVT